MFSFNMNPPPFHSTVTKLKRPALTLPRAYSGQCVAVHHGTPRQYFCNNIMCPKTSCACILYIYTHQYVCRYKRKTLVFAASGRKNIKSRAPLFVCVIPPVVCIYITNNKYIFYDIYVCVCVYILYIGSLCIFMYNIKLNI
jgi:hypothetical protein